jgi:hypothetical protein
MERPQKFLVVCAAIADDLYLDLDDSRACPRDAIDIHVQSRGAPLRTVSFWRAVAATTGPG